MAINAPEVLPQPIPDVRLQPAASLETFGGGQGLEAVGQQTQKLAAEGGEIASFEKIRADQTFYQDADSKLASKVSDLVTNPETGLPSYRGINAMAGHDKVMQEYKKFANDLYGTANGQAQQGALHKLILAKGDLLNQHSMAYADKEREQSATLSYKAMVNDESQLAGTMYGNDHALTHSYNTVLTGAKARAEHLGLDQPATENFVRDATSQFHETVLSQMISDPNFMSKAKTYFGEHRGEMSIDSRDRIESLFDAVPKQQEAAAKHQQEESYKANMRQSMLDMFDGKLTLSEAQRRFKNGDLDKSDYNLLEGKLSKRDALFTRSEMQSDPETFNDIRQAQLTGSATPGEIQRMIAKGSASGDIKPEDGKYLLSVNDEKPPTPRDKYIEAQAREIREFGSRYFAENNFFGSPTNQDKTSQKAESLVNSFYSAVDQSKADVKQIDEIKGRLMKMAAQERYPGLGRLDKMPDVVIDIKGKVHRLLSPEQQSGLKPKYRISPVSDNAADDDQP